MKGQSFTMYFLLFIGSLILSLLIIYFILYGGLGIVRNVSYYHAKLNAEMLASLISASASFHGSFKFSYILPEGQCEVKISENSVKMEVPTQTISVGGRNIRIKKTETENSIIKPKSIKIFEFNVECLEKQKQFFVVEKNEDKIGAVLS